LPRRVLDFTEPDRFVAGAVGAPGQRTFYLQARQGRAVVSVRLEKLQVTVLAQRLGELLEQVRQLRGDPEDDPDTTPDDEEPLDEPVIALFSVGTMTLAWEPASSRVVMEAYEETETAGAGQGEEPPPRADEDPQGPDLLRVRMTRELARGFIRRATRIVTAGRPPCPLCGLPLDPQGHVCPRGNGRLN
jgi:uncharacterized repeat protein (TIGR03847 family)